LRGRKFKPLAEARPRQARELIEKGMAAFARGKRKRKAA
jgi:hypothetical protein